MFSLPSDQQSQRVLIFCAGRMWKNQALQCMAPEAVDCNARKKTICLPVIKPKLYRPFDQAVLLLLEFIQRNKAEASEVVYERLFAATILRLAQLWTLKVMEGGRVQSLYSRALWTMAAVSWVWDFRESLRGQRTELGATDNCSREDTHRAPRLRAWPATHPQVAMGSHVTCWPLAVSSVRWGWRKDSPPVPPLQRALHGSSLPLPACKS